MPSLLAAGDLGVSFILPCFSKLGSSPTKVAEYLASGLVAVVNDGVGDMGELAGTEGCQVLAARLDMDTIERAASHISRILDRPYPERAAGARRLALERFSLRETGVPRYERLYQDMCRGSRASSSSR